MTTSNHKTLLAFVQKHAYESQTQKVNSVAAKIIDGKEWKPLIQSLTADEIQELRQILTQRGKKDIADAIASRNEKQSAANTLEAFLKQAKMVKCPVCNGDGKSDEDPSEACGECGGKGQVEPEDLDHEDRLERFKDEDHFRDDD